MPTAGRAVQGKDAVEARAVHQGGVKGQEPREGFAVPLERCLVHGRVPTGGSGGRHGQARGRRRRRGGYMRRHGWGLWLVLIGWVVV